MQRVRFLMFTRRTAPFSYRSNAIDIGFPQSHEQFDELMPCRTHKHCALNDYAISGQTFPKTHTELIADWFDSSLNSINNAVS